jgi:DNA replication protein DnaC
MEHLQYQMKSLRLSGMASVLPTRLQEAKANELTYEDFIGSLLQDELDRRKDRLMNRRLKAARFPFVKTLDDFDFTFNTTINKRQIVKTWTASSVFRH